MNYKIVFSIPVHESPETIFDQIVNFMHFNPDCAIVLHFSKTFSDGWSRVKKERLLEILSEYSNIFINPVSLRTGFADIIQTHISNFRYVSKQICFEYFNMAASNELFFRKGLYDYLKNYDCLVEDCIYDGQTWDHSEFANKDMDLKKMMAFLGEDVCYLSKIEGQTYKTGLFSEMVDTITEFYDYKKMPFAYPREEIYFSSIIHALNKTGKYSIGLPHTYLPWYRINYRPTLLEIWALTHPSPSHIFSFKRVDRFFEDYVRSTIRKMGGYEKQVCKTMGLKTSPKYILRVLKGELKDPYAKHIMKYIITGKNLEYRYFL